MPCLAVLLAFFFPRLVLLGIYIFNTPYLANAYTTWLWPVLGFFFLPYTTLAYTWGWHQSGGSLHGFPLVVVVIAVLADLGVIGGGAKARKRRT